ncbi:ribosome small subunit-dependent GTPase A [Thioalkalivibrio sp. XN8]|uniref:ribosome small subunit-dependent GTPase A n=1 Tax=Thioalkalivibrio sp. XN8 TaxID=2712863 RepID=UPI0013E9ADCE|nr:ribosome small subunit-dependent GTPase A [Thioalkalivibrio sp. XN8]NGP53525.1 ribosome small subunit-dependent GTPase A [Thioalkalivibrio sp. XN8]
MNLRHLGFDDWFSGQAAGMLRPGQAAARVTAVDRDVFVVRDENGETPAALAGRFRHKVGVSPDLPCVGDWVGIERAGPELAIIHAVLPRRSFLRRKAPGKTVDFQMIAANIDVAFIVQSCQYDFNVRRLERYLVVCREGGIEPFVLLSKTDLADPLEIEGLLAAIAGAGIDAPVIPISTATGDGLEQFRALLEPGKTYCLIGSSGVGKSTLVNRLLGRDELDTRAVSATGEGTHTTSRRQLLVLDDGTMLIDTPGMRELGLLGASEGLDESFADIRALAAACRFTDCTHASEPGCAVRAAIESHTLSEARYRGYLKLKKESEYHDTSYVERRKKDREFGRYVNSVMKQKKR